MYFFSRGILGQSLSGCSNDLTERSVIYDLSHFHNIFFQHIFIPVFPFIVLIHMSQEYNIRFYILINSVSFKKGLKAVCFCFKLLAQTLSLRVAQTGAARPTLAHQHYLGISLEFDCFWIS